MRQSGLPVSLLSERSKVVSISGQVINAVNRPFLSARVLGSRTLIEGASRRHLVPEPSARSLISQLSMWRLAV